MSEFEVLHDEPRYKVDSFVNEILGRTKDVIAEMSEELERLLRDLVDQFKKYQEDHYLLGLDHVKVKEMTWTKDGHLSLSLHIPGGRFKDDDVQPHQVVDEFVASVVAKFVPLSIQRECSHFLRGMIMQFAALKKTQGINLRLIKFSSFRWVSMAKFVSLMTLDGKPYTPTQQARLE